MNRQPPAFLERLVGRLIPAASREHVLGDLAERYTSPSQYFFDATRTIPFVVAARVRRSAVTTDVQPALQLVLWLTIMGVVFSLMRLQYGETIKQWYPTAYLLFSLLWQRLVSSKLPPVHVSYGNLFLSSPSILKQALARRIAELQIIVRFGAMAGIGFILVASVPLVRIVLGRVNGVPATLVDGTFMVYAVALVVLAAGFVLAAGMYVQRQLRNLQQKLDNLE